MADTLALTTPRTVWVARGMAAAAVALGAGLAWNGAPDAAIVSAVVGLAALGVMPRAASTGTPALELLRGLAARAGAAERLEGSVTGFLAAMIGGGYAETAIVMVKRGEGGFCDAYLRVDGQLLREELLWQPELGVPGDESTGTQPRLPTRIGRPRSWLTRPMVARGEVCGSLILIEPRSSARDWLGPALAVIAAQLGAQVQGERFSDRLEHGYVATIEALIGALEAKDPYTAGHSSRVASYALAIASEMGLEDGLIEELETGAVLHDIGKIGVGDGVLFKPGRLSDAEFAEIKDHPRRGARIIDAFNRSPTVLGVVFHHHERYDGRGYPAGLRGVDIPLCARIVNVADAYDAMTTNRPYQSTRTRAEALAELRKGAGSQFDPDVVAALDGAFGRGVI